LNDPVMLAKLAGNQAPKPAAPAPTDNKPTVGAVGDMALMSAVTDTKPKVQDPPKPVVASVYNKNGNMQSLIAGIIIGSPEFQRR